MIGYFFYNFRGNNQQRNLNDFGRQREIKMEVKLYDCHKVSQSQERSATSYRRR